MGCLYQPRYKAVDGALKTAKVWWIKFRGSDGREHRESTETRDRAEARRLLKRREGMAAEGKPITPHAEKVTLHELADDLKAEYTANARRSAERLKYSLANLLAYFGQVRAMQIRSRDVDRYIVHRQEQLAANGTINRELAALKRMYRIAIQGERLHHAPHIALLQEAGAREGFIEPAQFEVLVSKLPADLQDFTRFGYATGWRKGALQALRWDDVDRQNKRVFLRRESSKNARPYMIPLTDSLLALVERRWQARQWTQQDGTIALSELVFHRYGKPLGDIRKAWASACQKAGVPGLLFHDLRRSAVRNLTRAGVPQTVAMRITGHETASVFERYNIATDDDVARALQASEMYTARQKAQTQVVQDSVQVSLADRSEASVK